jgi:hypothetical protein
MAPNITRSGIRVGLNNKSSPHRIAHSKKDGWAHYCPYLRPRATLSPRVLFSHGEGPEVRYAAPGAESAHGGAPSDQRGLDCWFLWRKAPALAVW